MEPQLSTMQYVSDLLVQTEAETMSKELKNCYGDNPSSGVKRWWGRLIVEKTFFHAAWTNLHDDKKSQEEKMSSKTKACEALTALKETVKSMQGLDPKSSLSYTEALDVVMDSSENILEFLMS